MQEQILERIHIPNKNHTKITSQQIMVANLHGKKVHSHQDDEIMYVFTPTKQSYNGNLKNILFWISSRKEERAWANKAKLVGMFEIEWKTPCHNILVEFLNNWKLDQEHNKIKVMLGEEQRIIDMHVLIEVFRIRHIGEIKANQVKMFDARVTLTKIANRILDTYNTNERRVVKKMRSIYVNRIATILLIIYPKDKVQYFNNKSPMMISRADHGKSVNWAAIMYSQLVKKFIKWKKFQKNMIEGTTKTEPKKGCMPFYHSP